MHFTEVTCNHHLEGIGFKTLVAQTYRSSSIIYSCHTSLSLMHIARWNIMSDMVQYLCLYISIKNDRDMACTHSIHYQQCAWVIFNLYLVKLMGIRPTDLEGQLFITLICISVGTGVKSTSGCPVSVLHHIAIQCLPPESVVFYLDNTTVNLLWLSTWWPTPSSKGGELVVLVPFPGGFLVATNSTSSHQWKIMTSNGW